MAYTSVAAWVASGGAGIACCHCGADQCGAPSSALNETPGSRHLRRRGDPGTAQELTRQTCTLQLPPRVSPEHSTHSDLPRRGLTPLMALPRDLPPWTPGLLQILFQGPAIAAGNPAVAGDPDATTGDLSYCVKNCNGGGGPGTGPAPLCSIPQSLLLKSTCAIWHPAIVAALNGAGGRLQRSQEGWRGSAVGGVLKPWSEPLQRLD